MTKIGILYQNSLIRLCNTYQCSTLASVACKPLWTLTLVLGYNVRVVTACTTIKAWFAIAWIDLNCIGRITNSGQVRSYSMHSFS